MREVGKHGLRLVFGNREMWYRSEKPKCPLCRKDDEVIRIPLKWSETKLKKKQIQNRLRLRNESKIKGKSVY